MSISIQEVTDREQWNDFLLRQPRGHLLQSFEWGELNKFLGTRIYRLGALDEGRLVGVMMLSIADVPLPVRVPGVTLRWLYSSRGPTVESPDSPALPALIRYVHTIARREHAVVLRVEPNIADDDPEENRWISAYRKIGFRDNPNSPHSYDCVILQHGDDATKSFHC